MYDYSQTTTTESKKQGNSDGKNDAKCEYSLGRFGGGQGGRSLFSRKVDARVDLLEM
jgi:hypothetical protein